MIKVEQIDQYDLEPLTPSQVLTLTKMVRRYKYYRDNIGVYTKLGDKLQEEVDTPTVKTQALKAVLAIYSTLPNLSVVTSPTEKSNSTFSSPVNWDELAQDVLDIFYDPEAVFGSMNTNSWLVVQRRIPSLIIDDGNAVKIIT